MFPNQTTDGQDGPGIYEKVQVSTFVVESNSCPARLERKLWSSGPLNILEKSRNHLRANSLITDRTLLVVRVILWALMSTGFIAVVRSWKWSDFKYFTVWGVTLTELYFCLLMAAYLVDALRGKGRERDPHSPLRMWKLVSVFF